MSDEPRFEANEPPDGADPSPPERSGTKRRVISLVIVVASIVIGFMLARDAVSSALIFAFILIALVVIHELAHFATAKLFGIYVHEFGVGFPPRLWGKRFGETEYTINWLPIGGFVRLMGEEDPSNPRSLAGKPRWQRLIILANATGVEPGGAWWRASSRGLVASHDDTLEAAVTGLKAGFKGAMCMRVCQVDALNTGFSTREE